MKKAQLGRIRQGIQAAITQVTNRVSTGKLPPARGQALLAILQTLPAQLGG